MRTRNVFKNLITAWTGQLIIVICTFISRRIFIQILPLEYLGINGLFTNILTLLSFADLGLGLSVSYYLYEPLAKNDKIGIVQTVRYFRKVYNLVGCIVLVVGLLLSPFLGVIIRDCKIPNIKLIYGMHVINASVSYFNMHKTTLLSADQKSYINTLYVNSIKILQSVVSIVMLIITGDYIVFYSVQIVATLLTNYLVSKRVDRLYPFIKEMKNVPKNTQLRKTIKDNLGAMILHKFSSVVVTGTDNILISMFVNLITVGMYSNYSMIVNNIINLISQLFGSMSAGIGNYSATENCERKIQLFYTLIFLQFWIYGFCSICLFILLSPFISLWLGEQFQLENGVVFVIVLNFYLQGMRKVVLMFRDAEGLFKQDCYKAVIEAIINLFVSLYLVRRIGLIGVFMGTVASTVLTCVWMEPFVLFRNSLQGDLKKYYLKYVQYFLEVFFAGFVTYIFTMLFDDTIVTFIIKVVICCIVPNIVFLILHYRDDEFKQLMEKVGSMIKRKKDTNSIL